MFSSGLPVVIPAAPGSPYLGPVLQSLAQAGAAPICVVSESPLAELGQEVRSLRCQADAGFAARANLGLLTLFRDGHKQALLLNDDTTIDSTALCALQDALARREVAAAGATLLDWTDGSIQQSGLGFNQRLGRLRSLRAPVSGMIEDRTALSGAALALDLEAFHAIGGFSEAFSFYFEDVDLCLRLRKAGHRVVVVRDAKVRHFGGGTQAHESPEAAWHLGRSQLLLSRRLGGSRSEQGLRMTFSAALALAWGLRHQGLAGFGPVCRGLLAGLRAEAWTTAELLEPDPPPSQLA